MKALMILFLMLGSLTSYAQVMTYDYPRIDGNRHNRRLVDAYISSKSDLDRVCQILSGATFDSGTRAISRKTKKIYTGYSESNGFRDLVRISGTKGTNWNDYEWFSKQTVKERNEDRVLSQLKCDVVGVWTKVYITDNTQDSKKSNENVRDSLKRSEEDSQVSVSSDSICGSYKSYTYGWGGHRYDSSDRSDCSEAKNEAINSCLYSEGARGESACKSNVSACLSNPCKASFIGRTYGWGGQVYESAKKLTCTQAKQEAINNCLYQEGSRATAACKDNASCVEFND
jgi:hypothetical protein